MTALQDLSATEAVGLLRSREISAEELVRACLDRIMEREPVLHAWAHVDPHLAIAQARERDRQPPDPPLHGLPIGVKDIIDTDDQPTAYGTDWHVGHRPWADADCVRRLRRAGAIILGKTVTSELAASNQGIPTANPHDLTRTPGGSSSGSAAAVADHMVPVALGTQTAGSVIRPASFCGIYGLKPTFRAVDLTGVSPVAPSLDTFGVFARSAEDLTLVASQLMRIHNTQGEGTTGLRVAFLRTSEWPSLAPAARYLIRGVHAPPGGGA